MMRFVGPLLSLLLIASIFNAAEPLVFAGEAAAAGDVASTTTGQRTAERRRSDGQVRVRRGYDDPRHLSQRRLRALAGSGATKGVPDDHVVVRGGTSDLPPPGETFSGAAGRTLDDAASGVPHGQIRSTTAGRIRAGGGRIDHAPELTRSGVLNERHVNVCLGQGPCPFGPLTPNPVPKSGRIR